MEYLKNFFSRWGTVFIIGLVLSIIWIFTQYGLHYEELSSLPIVEITLQLTKKFIELLLFLLILKAVIGSNAVLNSIDIIFKNIYFKRDFLKTLKHKQLLEIANDIHDVDSTILISDEMQKRNAYKSIQTHWYDTEINQVKPYVVLESNYIDTLYTDGQLIIHKKYILKMMKTDNFEMEYNYLPFDKNIHNDITQESYYQNQPGNRWSEKSFKHRMINAHPAQLTLSKTTIKNQEWLKFHFKTKRKIQKGTIFNLEFSMTDKIKLDNSKESIKRRNQYFKIEFTSMVHGIRNITFQLESYNNSQKDNKLPFEPVLLIDEKEASTEIIKSTKETIYYKQWSWSILKKSRDPKSIKFELHEEV